MRAVAASEAQGSDAVVLLRRIEAAEEIAAAGGDGAAEDAGRPAAGRHRADRVARLRVRIRTNQALVARAIEVTRLRLPEARVLGAGAAPHGAAIHARAPTV